MLIIKANTIFNEADSAVTSEDMFNQYADTFTIEVDGDGTGFTLAVEGKFTKDGTAYTQLSGVNLSDITIVDDISANGIYSFDISGIPTYRLNLKAIGGGKVTVNGRSTANWRQ